MQPNRCLPIHLNSLPFFHSFVLYIFIVAAARPSRAVRNKRECYLSFVVCLWRTCWLNLQFSLFTAFAFVYNVVRGAHSMLEMMVCRVRHNCVSCWKRFGSFLSSNFGAYTLSRAHFLLLTYSDSALWSRERSCLCLCAHTT